jgi:hypothetical protein
MAKRHPARASDQPELAFSTRKASGSPEETARKAVARRPTTPSGRVSYTITLALPRDVAERLTALAIREGKNIEAVVAAARMTPRFVSAADLPCEPDPVTAWIRLDRLTRRVIGGGWSTARRRRPMRRSTSSCC